MLDKTQMIRLVLLGLGLWGLATAYIHWQPEALTDPVQSSLGFVTAPLGGWLSIWLVKRYGRLNPDQLLSGVALVGAVAMMIDGAALRWMPSVYSSDDTLARLGAAWLLWGYGVSFAVALVLAARQTKAAPSMP